MGFGSYWAVIFGCEDTRSLCANEETADQLEEILSGLDIQCSYEGSSAYAGVLMQCTIFDGPQIPSGVMAIDDLPAAIRGGIKPAEMKKAEATWRKAMEVAREIGVTLPEGALLWLGDYD